MRDADNGGCYACVRVEGTWEISVPSSQFCCEPATDLKIIVLIRKKIFSLADIPSIKKLELVSEPRLLKHLPITCTISPFSFLQHNVSSLEAKSFLAELTFSFTYID